MLSALYAIARPSVRLSHGWIGQKRLKLGSCNFHQKVAPYDSVLVVNFEIPKGTWEGGGAECEMDRKNTQLLANKSPYLRNGARCDQS